MFQALATTTLILATLLWAPAARAQQQDGAEVTTIREADRVIVRKKAVVDFTDVTVDGELTSPEGSYVLNKTRTDFESLIRIRDDFAPELQKSVDNL
ncbi:MAG TPA: hypothetical protein VK013_10340 [Myxococcaceae bacterium]|nr:hypothetical protein [Myxococcaceae bacterium]